MGDKIMTREEKEDLMHNINNPLCIIAGTISIKKEIDKALILKQVKRIAEYLKTLEVDEK